MSHSPFLPEYFGPYLGEYVNVLAALEKLNVAILKAMDKTKEVREDVSARPPQLLQLERERLVLSGEFGVIRGVRRSVAAALPRCMHAV